MCCVRFGNSDLCITSVQSHLSVSASLSTLPSGRTLAPWSPAWFCKPSQDLVVHLCLLQDPTAAQHHFGLFCGHIQVGKQPRRCWVQQRGKGGKSLFFCGRRERQKMFSALKNCFGYPSPAIVIYFILEFILFRIVIYFVILDFQL